MIIKISHSNATLVRVHIVIQGITLVSIPSLQGSRLVGKLSLDLGQIQLTSPPFVH